MDCTTPRAAANGYAPPGEYAADYLRGGLSVIPIKGDGTKSPVVRWTPYQRQRATEQELRAWFLADNIGVAIIAGAVSGNVEVIDVDNADLCKPFCKAVESLKPGLIGRLTTIKTPRPGGHFYYRCETIEGNQKLAEALVDGKPKTLIETRGEGGYVLAPGCPASCHDTGRSYEHISGPPLGELPTITVEEREILFRAARSFHEVADESPRQTAPSGSGLSPGDDYNQRAEWADILCPHGWELDHAATDRSYWRRPGKSNGWSATTGLRSNAGNELFCCFTDNAYPFAGAINGKPCTSYSKFAAYALLNHGDDYSAAAKQLASDGYGERREQTNGKATAEDSGPIPTGAEKENPHRAERVEYTRISSRELAGGNYDLEYLIQDAMVAGQPLILAGPQKTLKTSFIIDAAVALATGGCFLGRLRAGRACRVAVMTGESGLATIQETAIRVCVTAGRHLHELENLIWSPDLPKFGSVAHLDALERFLTDDEIEVLFIDPAYLAMPGADAGNVMVQGELLRSVSELCRKVGVTMVLAHHTKKHTGRDAGEPGELADIAWSGFAEFARQWWLINRREAYEPGTGEHKLWLSIGGSAGHSSLWAVDVNEGVRSELSERTWQVDVRTAAEARQEQAETEQDRTERAKQEKLQARIDTDKKSIIAAMTKIANPETANIIRDRAGVSGTRWTPALAELLEDGVVVPAPVKKSNREAPYDGYALPPTDSPESTTRTTRTDHSDQSVR